MFNIDPTNYAIESGSIGAIGESGSLMLQVSPQLSLESLLFFPVYKTLIGTYVTAAIPSSIEPPILASLQVELYDITMCEESCNAI